MNNSRGRNNDHAIRSLLCCVPQVSSRRKIRIKRGQREKAHSQQRGNLSNEFLMSFRFIRKLSVVYALTSVNLSGYIPY